MNKNVYKTTLKGRTNRLQKFKKILNNFDIKNRGVEYWDNKIKYWWDNNPIFCDDFVREYH